MKNRVPFSQKKKTDKEINLLPIRARPQRFDPIQIPQGSRIISIPDKDNPIANMSMSKCDIIFEISINYWVLPPNICRDSSGSVVECLTCD